MVLFFLPRLAALVPVRPAAPADAQAPVPAGFLPHVHLLRGVAILLVVGAHCWPSFAWTPAQQRWVLLLFDNVTVVFMAISGLLFQHLSGRFRYRRYLAHRFATVILPYLVISMPAVLVAVFVRHRDGVWDWVYRMPAWEEIAFFLLTGRHLAPLWFVPMMALFILAAPLFVLIDRRNLYPVVLPLAVVIASAVGRDSVQGVANLFGKALFMAPAYLAGMAWSRHRIAAERWCAAHVVALTGALALVSAAILLAPTGAGDLSLVQKLLLAPLLLLALRRSDPGPVLSRALGRLAELSFGIYFVHGYVLTTLRLAHARWGGAATFLPSIAGLLLYVAVVAALSVAIVLAARRLLGARSRYVVGA